MYYAELKRLAEEVEPYDIELAMDIYNHIESLYEAERVLIRTLRKLVEKMPDRAQEIKEIGNRIIDDRKEYRRY